MWEFSLFFLLLLFSLYLAIFIILEHHVYIPEQSIKHKRAINVGYTVNEKKSSWWSL